MGVQVRFLPNDVTIEAEVGEPILQVADRAGLSIPTGCLVGSCHACEVELANGEIICACIGSIPPDRQEFTINLYVDPSW